MNIKDEFYVIEIKRGSRSLLCEVEYDEIGEAIILNSRKSVTDPSLMKFERKEDADRFLPKIKNDVNSDNPSVLSVSLNIKVGET